MVRGLYAITDENLMPHSDALLEKARAALQGGCRLLQYRDKNSPPARRRARAESLARLCREHGARLIINDRPDLARQVAADGVHLGLDDGDLTVARQRLGKQVIIGATCHGSLELAAKAAAAGADYLAFGRFFSSRTKPQAPPASPELLREARQRFPLPLVAIGGVTVDNAPQLADAGADAVAVCHDLFGSDDPDWIAQRAARYASIFRH